MNAASVNGTYPPGAYAAGSPAAGQAVTDPILDESRKRHYASLFADNVALSYRRDMPTTSPTPTNLAQPQSNSTMSNPDPLGGQDQLLAQAGAQLAREEQLLQQMQQAAGGFPVAGARATAGPKGSETSSGAEREHTKNLDVAEPESALPLGPSRPLCLR